MYIRIRQNTQYKKKHRIRGAILSHQQSLCYLWTHHHCNSAIKLINLGVSCFLQEHLRWSRLIKVHTYITFESTESLLSFEMTLAQQRLGDHPIHLDIHFGQYFHLKILLGAIK